jgi:hypothetical protein
MNMNKKLSIVLGIAALSFVTQLQAQLYVGIEGGANRNHVITNTSDKPFFTYESQDGYSFGIPIRYVFPRLSQWFGGIQAIPSVTQKNYRMQRTGFYSPMYQDYQNSYLELPIMAQFRFGGHLQKEQSLYGILNLGGFGGYWMSGHVKGRALSPMDLTNYQEFDEDYTFSTEKDNRIELGALAGLGIQYMPNKKYVVSIEARYTPTLTDQQNAYSENQTPRYNDTYGVSVSVQYHLSSLKHQMNKTSK